VSRIYPCCLCSNCYALQSRQDSIFYTIDGVERAIKDSTGGGSSGITDLTGDVTASGPGSAAATLATVNSNIGSFTNANITVNAKGLITAASNGSGGASLPIDSVGIVRYGVTNPNNLASFDAGAKNATAKFVGASGSTITAKDSVNYTIGFESGINLTSGYKNLFYGTYSGRKSTTAYANIGIGHRTVGGNTSANFTGYGNIGIGFQLSATGNSPLAQITSGYGNTAIGSTHSAFIPAAGANMQAGAFNTMIGSSAGGAITSGNFNTTVGSSAGVALTTVNNNSLFGYRAGGNVTTAGNSIIGADAGLNLTTGTLDALGNGAGSAITTGARSFAIGANALGGAGGATGISGADNVAIGNSAMQHYGNNTASKAHARNLAIGNYAGQIYNTITTNNISIGYGGGLASTADSITGSNNIAIGVLSGLLSRSGSGQIIIGSSTDGTNPYRALISDISGSTRRWLFNATTTDVTAIANASAALEINGTSLGFLQPRLTQSQMTAISSPATGLSVYNTDSLRTAEYDGTTWKQTVYTPDIDIERRKAKYEYFNDFVIPLSATGNSGNDLFFSGTGTGSAIAAQTLSAGNQYGLITTTTGTTATGRASIQTSATAFRLGNGTWVYEQKVAIPTLSDGTNRFSFIAGFFDATTANQTDAVAFVYDEGGVSTGSTAAAYWQTATVSNSSRTWNTSHTQITVTAGQYYTLRIEINAAGTEVVFKVDGTTIATHTANIPTGSGREVGYGAQILKSIGTTARPFYTDYILAKSTLTTPR